MVGPQQEMAMIEQTFTDDMIVVAHGNALPTDTHLLSVIRAIDDGVIEYLKRREARQQRRKNERTLP